MLCRGCRLSCSSSREGQCCVLGRVTLLDKLRLQTGPLRMAAQLRSPHKRRGCGEHRHPAGSARKGDEARPQQATGRRGLWCSLGR